MPVDEPTVRHETIPLLPAQKKAIKEMESHMMTYLEDNPMVADIPLTQAQRIRQIALAVPSIEYVEDNPVVTFAEDCASPALDRAIDLLTDEMENECVVVFTDSQKFAAVVTARLNEVGISAFEFSGQTRGERDVMLSQLGTKYRVVVGVLAAIAEGVDGIQHVANNEIWLSRSTDETINEQAAGRTDRSGQTKQILRVYLHDDLGLSEGRFSEAVERRLLLNRSLRAA
jgi:ERCC4-related helicase